MALKDLGASLAAEGQGALVLFGFSDGVLFIQHGQTKIATPASGSDWPEVIAVQATEFRELPKRLMTKDILVVVGESHLRIGTLHYRLAQNGAS